MGKGTGDRPPYPTQEEFEDSMREVISTIYLGDGARFDRGLLTEHVRFHSASIGPPVRGTFVATVGPEMCNKMQTLHGGCAATLIDVLTSTILLALGASGAVYPGWVTRSLDLKFLRAVPLGTEVEIACELVHVGKRLALIRAEILKAKTGEVCITGDHDKATTGPEVGKL